MTAGIIAAKGHSSRLSNKNIKLFCGHPLVAWSIVQSVNSTLIDETYVSTDSEEIAEIGRKYGAQIIYRDFYEDEKAPVNVPTCKAIEKIKQTKDVKSIVSLLATSPTRFPDDIDNMIRLKKEMGFREISPVVPHNEAVENEIIGDHLCRMAFWDKTGRYVTQGGGMGIYDADYYLEIADVSTDIWTWEQAIEMHKKGHKGGLFFFRESPYYPLKAFQQFDIDYEDEFELLQIFMEHYILKGRGIEIYEDYKREAERMDRRNKEPA